MNGIDIKLIFTNITEKEPFSKILIHVYYIYKIKLTFLIVYSLNICNNLLYPFKVYFYIE